MPRHPRNNAGSPRWVRELWARLDGEKVERVWFKRNRPVLRFAGDGPQPNTVKEKKV